MREMGRPTKPDPSAATVKRLRTLVERRENAKVREQSLSDELAVEVARVRNDNGVSAHRLAELLGVGSSTVHGWTQRGRRLLGDDPR